MLRHRVFKWGTSFVAPALVLAVFVTGSRSTRAVDLSGLPQVGARLSAGISAPPIDSIGQTLIFVSDHCELCRNRAISYVRHLQRHDRAVLVVASSNTQPLFSQLADQYSELMNRIIFVPVGEFQSTTGVRTVPSYVRVNSSFQVTEVGMSHIGWFRSVMDPRHWLQSWSRLIAAN